MIFVFVLVVNFEIYLQVCVIFFILVKKKVKKLLKNHYKRKNTGYEIVKKIGENIS